MIDNETKEELFELCNDYYFEKSLKQGNLTFETIEQKDFDRILSECNAHSDLEIKELGIVLESFYNEALENRDKVSDFVDTIEMADNKLKESKASAVTKKDLISLLQNEINENSKITASDTQRIVKSLVEHLNAKGVNVNEGLNQDEESAIERWRVLAGIDNEK